MAVRDFGEVRRAGAEDIRGAAEAFAAASVDEAVVSWITPDEEARGRRAATAGPYLADWLGEMLGSAEIHLVSGGDGVVAGLAMWHRVGEGADGGEDEVAVEAEGDAGAALARLYNAEGLARLARVQELVGLRHPSGPPHWYLSQTAVEPSLRGRGLGGALLRYQLGRLDAEGAAAYLEASSPRNRVLYERHGFRSLGEPIVLPDGGPRLQPMWREGRSGLRPAAG